MPDIHVPPAVEEVYMETHRAKGYIHINLRIPASGISSIYITCWYIVYNYIL